MPKEAVVANPNEADLLDKEPQLVLTDLDSRREHAIRRDKDLFRRAIEGKAWNAYRGLLARSMEPGLEELAKGQGLNRFDAVWKEPVFYQAFLRWKLLGRLSEEEISGLVGDSYSGEMLTWLCYNTPAMEEFLLTIKPEDDGGKVLKFLIDAWPNTTGMMQKYFPLALACAVVFDQEVAISNPVAGPYAGQVTVGALPRFMWFIEKNEKGLLAAPVPRGFRQSPSVEKPIWAATPGWESRSSQTNGPPASAGSAGFPRA